MEDQSKKIISKVKEMEGEPKIVNQPKEIRSQQKEMDGEPKEIVNLPKEIGSPNFCLIFTLLSNPV
jgi:hypothetical protein